MAGSWHSPGGVAGHCTFKDLCKRQCLKKKNDIYRIVSRTRNPCVNRIIIASQTLHERQHELGAEGYM